MLPYLCTRTFFLVLLGFTDDDDDDDDDDFPFPSSYFLLSLILFLWGDEMCGSQTKNLS